MAQYSNHSRFNFDTDNSITTQRKENSERKKSCRNCFCLVIIAFLFLILLTCGVVAGVYIGCNSKQKDCQKTDEKSQFSTTAEPLPKPADIRLPKNVIPKEYFLQIRSYMPSDDVVFEPEKKFTFEGELKILLECQKPTEKIVLNSDQLDIDEKSVFVSRTNEFGNTSDGDINVKGILNKPTAQMVVFKLEKTLEPGKFYEIRLNYSGPISTELAGYFRSSYKENGATKWLSTTQFSPVDARKAFPGFDEPNFKAVFKIEMVHPKNYKAISNRKEKSLEELGNGWILTKFHPSPKMSTYIVGFTLCDFAYTESSTTNGVLFRVWSRKSLVNQTVFAAEIGPKFLEYQENYFGVKFPLEKQDMLAIPDFEVGAMENWGMINFRESNLLYDPDLKSLREKEGVASTLAHELAHMWFGNLVTMEWFSDVWLKEGFASIMESITLDAVLNGSFSKYTQFVGEKIQTAMTIDQLATSHPLSVHIERPYEVYEIFDGITYKKSGAVINMVRQVIGDEHFKIGLNNYLSKFAYGNARHNDIWDAISEAVQKGGDVLDWDGQTMNVTKFAAPWTLQMGFPLVSIRRIGPTSVSIEQSRFKLDPTKLEKENYRNPTFEYLKWGVVFLHERKKLKRYYFSYQWYVPIWFKTDKSHMDYNEIAWLQPHTHTKLPLDHDIKWYVVDSGSRGYYRTNYDLENWKALTQQLASDHTVISPQTRSQLLSDSFTLARSGQLIYDIPLNLTKYIISEDNYVPYSAAMYNLKFIHNMFVLTPGYGAFKNYMGKLTTSVYNRYGLNYQVSKNDLLMEKMNKIVIADACIYGNSDCISKIGAIFAELKTNCSHQSLSSTCNNIQPQLRGIVYCNGVRTGGTADWEFLWSKLINESLTSESYKIYSGLSCTKELWLLNRFLAEALSGSIIRRQDMVAVFAYVSKQPLGRGTIWNFFARNWKQIYEKFGDSFFSIGKIIATSTSSFNYDYQIDQLKQFMADNPETAKFSKFASQIEKAEQKSQWMKNYYETLNLWFGNHQK